jgi:hypothetical protein
METLSGSIEMSIFWQQKSGIPVWYDRTHTGGVTVNLGWYFFRQHHGEQSWFSFLFWPFLWLAIVGFSYGHCDRRQVMPAKIIARAPFQAIEQAVNEARPEGYIVRQDGEFIQDPGHVNRISIEYRLEKSDNSDVIIYRWTWEVPQNILNVEDESKILSRSNEFILTPLTDPARELNPRVLELIAQNQ